MAVMTRTDVLEYLEKANMLEISELIKEIEVKFGVTAAAPVSMVAPVAAAASGAVAVEKDTFDVVLASAGDKKIQVIKAVREVTDLGLKEAKDLVDGAPKPLKQGLTKAQAEEIKKKFEDVGATVELK